MREGLFIIGRGVGQVMFQNNAVSGLLMLVGIACNSWLLALFALLGNFVGTLTAFFSGYSKEDIEDGLYGFNGTLVGIAVGIFMETGIASLLLLVAGSVLSTWIARVFGYQKLLPGFTAPFILTVWLLLALCRLVSLIVVAFCDVGRNDVRLVSGFQSEYRSGHVPRRHGAFRTFLFGRHIAQFPYPCLVYGVGSLVAFGHGLDGRFRLCGFQCRFVWV